MECILLLGAHYRKLFIPITLLLLLSFPVLASRQEQKITLNVSNKTLKNVFHAIEEQTDVLIMYDLAVIDDNEKVSINVKEMVLEDVLNKLFYNKPVKWSKKGNVVRVFIEAPVKEPGSFGDPVVALVNISGQVISEDGTPLPNASVYVKGTKSGMSTNDKGEFTFMNLPETAILVIRYTGFESREIPIKGQKRVFVTLQQLINKLDETVIQGYGTTTRRITTSDIGKVTAEEIGKQPVMNPLLALQGKVAGLDITQTNGFASAPVKVELRGRSAINDLFTSDPLYIIDGVPITILELGQSSSYAAGSTGFLQSGFNGPAGGQSPLFSVNPSDIESIEVLKDADATAIYGSRGANGVILITTKKGKAGKTSFDIHIQEGISKQTRFWHMLDTKQYLQMRREAFHNDGIDITTENAHDLLVWDTTRYTDWQKVLYGGTGKNTDVQAGLSGGNSNTTFRFGVGYNHATNIMTISGADQRGTLSVNLSNRSSNQRFSIGFSGSYNFTKSDMTNFPLAIILPPNAPSIYDASGNLNYSGWGGDNASLRQSFPFGAIKQPYISKTNFLTSNITIDYELLKGLNIKTSLGYNNSQANQQQFTPIASQDPFSNPTGNATWGYNNSRNWIIEPQITYGTLIGQGKINVLAGASLQRTNTDATYVNGSGYTTDDLIKTVTNAPNQYTQQNFGEYRYAALFGRITYNFKNKYILNLNGRRDGSSRFGPGNQYGNFGSIGVAWIFTEEKWAGDFLRFLSYGKLRGSYGTTGSDAVGDYQYLTRWSSNNVRPYNGVSPLVPTQHAAPNYHWQVNRKLEGAIDVAFFKDMVNLSIAYYKNRCGDQLVAFPTPDLSGFGSVTANSPALVDNSGWEFTLAARIINTKDFKWALNFNAAINRNRLISYPNIEQSPYSRTLIVGRSLNIVQLYHYTGVDPKTGEYTVEDKDHDGQILFNPNQPHNDAYPYDLSPKFFGGLGLNFSYKSFQLGGFFNIKKQIGRNALGALGKSPGGMMNQPIEIFGKQWTQPGDIAEIGRFTTGALNSIGYYNLSDQVYTDASFIRLSNVSLSYNLPTSYIRRIGMKGCSIYMHANNLFVLTKYKGIDPETQSFGSLPPSKIIVGGINLNF